ncbi:MAG TPA: alcohol dehydrogenase catalytic domain-containing protein, partial [Thermoplasmata archaeon]|nr:alcohol dehydrogenase catalytic domain-containing protein [Thermoplasmata archaeon]
MRAIAVQRFRAAPESMDLPRPVAGPGELLVRVSFAGVNPFDAKIADGILEGHRPHVFPLVLGVDASGVVEGVGGNVDR